MPDRIEKQIVLRAPIARVWRAVSDRREFGTWFRAALPDGTFAAGERVEGRITYPGYEHLALVLEVERVEPPRLLAFRWHPNATDPAVDYAAEPPTTVTFRLEQVPEGTRLAVTESGFDALPAWRRDAAFRGNADGWAAQLQNIERYVADTP